VLELLDASLHLTVIVYTRPAPLPDRSARNQKFNARLIAQSGAVSPSPVPSTGSLLEISATSHFGEPSAMSATATFIDNSLIM
jgi:hypothetical protein